MAKSVWKNEESFQKKLIDRRQALISYTKKENKLSAKKDLEEKLSFFHGREDTILYASCFDANAGIFECLLGP